MSGLVVHPRAAAVRSRRLQEHVGETGASAPRRGRIRGPGTREADGPHTRVRAYPGKSDPIDAVAVAPGSAPRPDLPATSDDTISSKVKLLVNRREDSVGERVRMINRFRWHLHELDPGQDPQPRALRSAGTRRALTHWLADTMGMVARMARDTLDDIDAISHRIDDVEKEIAARISSVARRC